MSRVSCFLVDLDDTLYSELNYVDSGYRVVAPAMAKACGADPAELLYRLRHDLRKNGRTGAFDRVVKHYKGDEAIVAALVELYRNHKPDVAFYPGARDALANLRRIAPVAIVTDGAALMQKRKIEALGLAPLVDAVVLCWECDAPKPATLAYELAAGQIGANLATAVVIGDDPLHDMAAAHAMKARAIRVRTGRLADLDAPDGRVEEHRTFVEAVAALHR